MSEFRIPMKGYLQMARKHFADVGKKAGVDVERIGTGPNEILRISGSDQKLKKWTKMINQSESKITEDAPANATGTAVAGTGDDSSTVIVKKKKPKQDKLMRRMGITETINRVIPDLEYELDEITARTNQLKEFALKSEKKLAYDKSTDQPKKYVAGLSDKEKKSHDRHLEKQGKKSDSDKSAYKQSPADKVAKTKPSEFTKKYKQMYGEDMSIQEAIKGLQNKSKKSGMSYSILKQVYDRGMAAWKGGHRPGTTPQQWAFARVNSFITKSPGTWGKADSDLAKKVRGS